MLAEKLLKFPVLPRKGIERKMKGKFIRVSEKKQRKKERMEKSPEPNKFNMFLGIRRNIRTKYQQLCNMTVMDK